MSGIVPVVPGISKGQRRRETHGYQSRSAGEELVVLSINEGRKTRRRSSREMLDER